MSKEPEQQISLEPRKKPIQKRSQQRVESILEACAELLRDVGPDGVNTNTIAERAGIPVSSLYQYFPNKHAVLVELLNHQLKLIDQAGAELGRVLEPGLHWQEICDLVLDAYLEFCKTLPGFTALWHTVQAHPDLYGANTDTIVGHLPSLFRLLGGYLEAQSPGRFSEADVRDILRAAVETIIPLIGKVARASGPDEEERLARDVKLIARGYLANFLPD